MDAEKYIGRLLDNRYEILEVLGVGGMAVVYKARCHRLNRLVAIKILKDDLSEDEEFRRRFHAESQAVAMLSHPNIMSVYDVSATEEADYIVMELIEGITLKQYMEKKGVLNWKETLHFAMQIGKALEHAHGRGIVHRDIKPHNVMVLKNGSVKVTDFGIARIMSKSNTLTKEALGSVHYISPEQAKGGRVDNRSDLYSLGVVMYEMMAGRPPYDGESPVAVAIQHINGGAAMPSTLNPNIPGGLEQIIMKAMDIDPAKRYATATALLYDLEEFRKNPSILFNFGAQAEEPSDMSATVVIPPVAVPAQPKTTAERVVSRSGGQSVSRVPAQAETTSRVPKTDSQRRAAQEARREQMEQARKKRDKTTKMAIICGSAVAVIAIIIFLVVLLNGGFGTRTTLVDVPQLVGKVWDEVNAEDYPNVELVLADMDYSDEFEAGLIMEQSPEAGEQVAVGTKVRVYVSLGKEGSGLPNMADLTNNMTVEAGKTYLNALNGNLDVKVEEEYSADVAEGYIIRTDPEAGAELEVGQTVTLYVSLGKEVIMAKVPSVIGLNKDTAATLLTNNGFTNRSFKEEDSLDDKNEVLRLETADGKELPAEEIDVTTEIVIVYSSGELYLEMPAVAEMTQALAESTLDQMGFTKVSTQEEYSETVPAGAVIKANINSGSKISATTAIVLTISLGPEPTTEATVADVTKTVTIELPTDMEEAYSLTIMFENETVVDGQTIQPGTASIMVQFTGTGVGTYEVYVNGEIYDVGQVDFDA